MKTVMLHELDMHNHSLASYLFCCMLLLTIGIGALMYHINYSVANFEYVLGSMCLVFGVAIPVLTMKSLADERRQKTDQLLYSLPLSMDQIVCGKYLAMVIVYIIPLLFICIYPLIFRQYGNVYLPQAYGSIGAFFLLGSALISIGLFISSLTENQGIAAGITAVAVILNYYITDLAEYAASTALGSVITLIVLFFVIGLIVAAVTSSKTMGVIVGCAAAVITVVVGLINSDLFVGLVPTLIKKLSLFERFYVFVDGVFDLTGVVYYLSVIALFLFLTVQSMEKRRYN